MIFFVAKRNEGFNRACIQLPILDDLANLIVGLFDLGKFQLGDVVSPFLEQPYKLVVVLSQRDVNDLRLFWMVPAQKLIAVFVLVIDNAFLDHLFKKGFE